MPRTNKPANGAIDAPKPARKSKPRNGTADHFNDPDAVAQRAYEIYQHRGGNHGSALDDWLEAERQLKPGPGGVTASVPAKPRRRKISEKTA